MVQVWSRDPASSGISLLGELRQWAGGPSYRTLAKRVGPLLRPPQVIAHTTISGVFQPQRRRLDIDLVTTIVRALGVDEDAVPRWRQACVRVHVKAKVGGPAGALRQLPVQALGLDPQAIPAELEERAKAFRNRLAGSRTLIVLDDAVSEQQVRPLLPAAPGCLVLAQPVPAGSGHEPGLHNPGDEAISLEGIADYHMTTGDPAQGVAYLNQALEIYQRLGKPADIERVQIRLADFAEQ